MRALSFIVLLPLACLASAQDTSIRVSYTTRAARAAKVLSDLSSITHVDLQGTSPMKSEVLVISVKDQSLSDVMTRIATATSGEWKHEGSTYRLVEANRTRKVEEQHEFSMRVEKLKKAIDDRAKRNLPQTTPAKNAVPPKAGEVVLPPETPEEAIITHLLGSLDVTVLANLSPGDRIVFSTEPTRTQHGFTGNSTEAIDAFIQKHNSSFADRNEEVDKALANMTAEQAAAVRNFTKKQSVRIGQVSKALLVTTCMGLGIFNMTQLELRLYDAKGSVAYSGTSMLTLPGDDLMAMVVAVQGKKPAVTGNKQTPIEYSEDSKALLKSTKGMTAGNFKLQLSPDLKRKLYTPSQFDPLSFATTDELLSYANSKGLPLVADVPDTAAGGLSVFLPGSTTTVESFEKDLLEGKSMVLAKDDKYLLIRPAYPAMARSTRLDRDALTELLQATDGKEVPSLDDLATYAMNAPDPMQGGVNQMYLTLFVPGASQQGLDGQTSWNMLRFYGHLSPDARSGLLAGNRILIGSFNGEQKRCLEQMTYGSMNQLTVSDPQRKADDQPYWMKIISGSSGTDYRDEPTEIVPNGLPADGYVDLKSTSESFASPVNDEGTKNVASLGILGADELAIFKMFKEDKNYAQISAMLPSFDKLRIGQRSVLTFTFHLTPLISVRQIVRDHHLSKDSPIRSDKNLPDDFQKSIDEKLAMFKKSPLAALGALMGGAKQPVHP